MVEDPAWPGALDKLEAGSEPPYYRADGWLLQATDYSPKLKPTSGEGTQRIYELRIYESPTEKQLRALNERFAGPEIPIFHRSGIHPVLYADMVVGPNMPNLTYLTLQAAQPVVEHDPVVAIPALDGLHSTFTISLNVTVTAIPSPAA